jgi:hypothetical protein
MSTPPDRTSHRLTFGEIAELSELALFHVDRRL